MEVEKRRKRVLSTDETQEVEKPTNKRNTKQSAPSKARIRNKSVADEKEMLPPADDSESEDSDYDDVAKKGKSAKDKLERGKKKTTKGKRAASEGTRSVPKKEAANKGKKQTGRKDKEESEDEEAEEEDDDKEEMEVEEEAQEELPTIRVTKPMEVEDEEAHAHEQENVCKVCYSQVSEPFLNKEMNHLFEMIHCRSCNTSVHLICHGLETATEEEQNPSAETKKKFFLCDSCGENQRPGNLNCYICGDSEGCLRYTKDKKWAHILCAVGGNNVNFEKVTKMQLDLSSFKKETQKIKADKKCEECKNKVGTLTCEGSNESCHLHCAMRSRAIEEKDSRWEVEFKLQQEAGFLSYREVDEELLMERVEEIATTLKKIVDKYDIEEIREEQARLVELHKPKASKAVKGKKKGDKEESFLQTVLEKTKTRVRQNFEGETAVEAEDLKSVGGKIILRHVEEKKTDEAKTTKPSKGKGKRKTKKEMETEEAQKQEKEEKDLTLQNTLINFGLEIKRENNLLVIDSNFQSKFKTDLPAFPTIESLTFPEVMFFVVVLQKRIDGASANLCSLHDMENIINSANMLPFSVLGLLKSVNQKYYITIATDIMLEHFIAACEPKSAFNIETKQFDEATAKRNSEVIELSKELQEMYSNKRCLAVTQQSEQGKRFHQHATFLNQVYTQMSRYFEKNPVSKKSKTVTLWVPQQNLHKGPLTPCKDDLPQVPLAVTVELASKAANLGLTGENLGEVKLLEKLNVGSNNLLGALASAKSNKSRGLTSLSKSEKNSVSKFGMEEEVTGFAGKLSLGKPGARSPFKLNFETQGKGGRQKKVETVINEIEKKCKEEADQVNKKESLKEAEKRLNKMKKKPVDEEEEEREGLEERVKRASTWKTEFLRAEKNEGVSIEFLEEMQDLDFRVPEMLRGLEHLRTWRLWSNSASNIDRRLKKKKAENNLKNDDAVTLEQLEQAIAEGEKLKIIVKEDGKLAELKEKLNLVRTIQEKVKDFVCTPEDLENLEKELKNVNIKFPEATILYDKLKVNKDIKRLLDETVSLEELEKKLEEVKSESGIDDMMMMGLRSKIEEANKKKSMVERFLQSGMDFELGETPEMANLVKQMKETKVVIPEILELESMLDKAVALWKVYACLFGGDIPDKDRLDAGQCLRMTEKKLIEIQKECNQALAKGAPIEIAEKRIKIIKSLCKIMLEEDKDLKNSNKFHQKIKLFFEQLNMAIVAEKIKKLDKMEVEEITPDDVADAAKKFFEETFVGIAFQLGKKKYAEVAEEVENLVHEFNGMKTRLEAADFQAEEEMATVKKLGECCEWLEELCKKRKAIQEGTDNWNYSRLDAFVRKMKELGFSQELAITKELVKLYEKVRPAAEEYEREFIAKKKEAVQKQEATVNLTDVKKILEQFKKLNETVSFEREIKQIEEEMATLRKSEDNLETKINRYLNMLVSQIVQTTPEKISNGEEEAAEAEILRLIKELGQLVIKSERSGEFFKKSKWLFNVRKMAKRFTKELVEEDEVAHLHKEGSQLLESHQIEEKGEALVNFLNKELTSADEIKKCVEKLRKAERATENKEQINEDTLDETVNKLKDCKITLESERKYLKNMSERTKTLKEKAGELLEEGRKQKKLQKDFAKMFEQLDKLPVRLEERDLISMLISEKNSLTKYCEKGAIKDFKDLIDATDRYRNFPITIENLEEVLKPLEQAASGYIKLKDRAEEMRLIGASFSELSEMRTKAKDLEKVFQDSWLDELYPEIFERKCEAINESEAEISVLKDLLKEGEECKVKGEKVEECLASLQKWIKEREEKVRDDESVQEPEVEIDYDPNNVTDDMYVFDEEPNGKESKSKSRKESVNKEVNNIEIDKKIDTILSELRADDLRSPHKKKPFALKKLNLRDSHPCILAVRRFLLSLKNLQLTEDKYIECSKNIIDTFPEIVNSKETFTNRMHWIRNLMSKHHGISKNLPRKKFESYYLRNLYLSDEQELKFEDKKLMLSLHETNKAPVKNDELGSPTILKKFKKDGGDALFVSGHGSPEKRSNTFASFNMNKMQKTDSAKRNNALKKMLKNGGNTSDFEFDDGFDRKDTFSDNGNDIEFLDNEPVTEIIYDKKIISKQLEPTHSKRDKDSFIMYDPDNPNAAPAPRDERRKSTKPQFESTNVGSRYIPLGTILKIFDGVLKTREDAKCPKIALFTCNDFNVVNTIPQLVKDGHVSLKMDGKMSQSKFEAYINKAFNSDSKEEKMVAGWVESHVMIYQNSLNQIAKDLIDTKKVGVCAYNESAKVFLLHKQQMHNHWKTPLHFQTKKVHMSSNPSLYFIIIYKPYKLKATTKSIAPEIVPSLDATEASMNMELKSLEGFGLRKKKMDEEELPSAPYEPDFGAEMMDSGSGDLWGQGQDTVKTPPKPKYTAFNTKRNWEEISNEKANKKFNNFNNKGYMADPRKKFKNDVVTTVEPEMNNDQPFFTNPNPSVEELTKMSRGDLLRTLQVMDQEKIIELAKEMDQKTRESVIGVLREINAMEKDTSVYRAPHYIQKIYNMFTPQQMQRAKNAVDSRRININKEAHSRLKNNHITHMKGNKMNPRPVGEIINLNESTNRPIDITELAKKTLEAGDFTFSGNTLTMTKETYSMIGQMQEEFTSHAQVKTTTKTNKIPLLNKYLGNKENSSEPAYSNQNQKRSQGFSSNMGNNQTSFNLNGIGSKFIN